MTCMGKFDRGVGTFSVAMRLFKQNRQRLCKELIASDQNLPKNSFVLLQGGSELPRYNTDINYIFRQESFFHWAFGVEEPDFYGALNVTNGKSYLFMPRLPEAHGVWLGKIEDPTFYRCKYEVDQVYFSDEISRVLKTDGASLMLLINGTNTDSDLTIQPAKFDKISEFKTDTETLYPIMSELRVFKTDLELDVIRYVCKVSCQAHIQVMQKCRPDNYEYQLESEFQHYCYQKGGARWVAYTCIAGSGHNCSVLHYGHAGAPNSKRIEDGDMCLFDMGAEYCCYASDITASFPANGRFTEDQKFIYNAVLDANLSVQAAARPGVNWVNMHFLAQRKILEHLLKGGLLVGNLDEMMKVNLGAIFMPHGLGHFMGLDVHDVGGYNGGLKRLEGDSLRNLRTIRTLQPRMVITVEPGCYFIDVLLDKAFNDEKLSGFLVREQIDRFRNSGGVRIEDDVLITENGVENLTILPRTVEEIELLMEGNR